MEKILDVEIELPDAKHVYSDIYRYIRSLCLDDDFYNLILRNKWNIQIDETTLSFFRDIDRFDPGRFIPTFEDALYARRKSVGIVQTEVKINGHNYRIIDVAGARSERKKV